jgi:hypothetical protein
MLRDISEAREQLEQIEHLLRSEAPVSDGNLQVLFEHTYHHLNWAWNTRSVLKSRYDAFTDGDFNAWAKVPKDLEPLQVDVRRNRT